MSNITTLRIFQRRAKKAKEWLAEIEQIQVDLEQSNPSELPTLGSLRNREQLIDCIVVSPLVLASR